MKNISVVILMATLVVACQKKEESSVKNGDFQVEKLFTNDGCTVYRFQDARTVYYADCRGRVEWTRSCGKSCTAHAETINGTLEESK